MGFNKNTLTDAEREEILEGHSASLDAYLARRIVDEPDFPVTQRVGGVRLEDQNIGHADDDHDEIRRPHGQPTAKGDFEMGSLTYHCEQYKYSYPITDADEMELSQAIDIVDKLGIKASHKALSAFERVLIDILKGNGTSGRNRDVETRTLTSDEKLDDPDASDHDPLGVIEDAVRACDAKRVIMGEDVAFALQKSPDVIGASGGEAERNTRISRPAMTEFFRTQFGITDTIVGVQRYNDGAETWDFNRSHLHDGVLYFDDGSNLVRPTFEDLALDEYEDDDSQVMFVRARMTADLIRKYPSNSYAIKDPVS